MNKSIPYERARRLMIEEQLRRRGIRDERVLEAMMNVPRHEFVPCVHLNAAYADRPLPIGAVETISQPYIVAAMTEAARVTPGDRALEVGTGSGYQAAILANLGARVYTVERNPQLVAAARERLVLLGYEGIEVIWGDGTEGYAPASPYQVIMVTAAAPDVPPPLFAQLANGGRLVIPLGDMARQDLYLMIKEDDQVTKRVLDPCMFVPLIGKYGWPERPGWIN
ncbi:MAG TPA: protein-L-isoaspartate(D-aspartate) O-methyltransferase [Terriglobia bacterium]|nr:protein-L-isoaspartate(D-aspartate) O-methyltransferase [Terriglobia bacterium]